MLPRSLAGCAVAAVANWGRLGGRIGELRSGSPIVRRRRLWFGTLQSGTGGETGGRRSSGVGRYSYFNRLRGVSTRGRDGRVRLRAPRGRFGRFAGLPWIRGRGAGRCRPRDQQHPRRPDDDAGGRRCGDPPDEESALRRHGFNAVVARLPSTG